MQLHVEIVEQHKHSIECLCEGFTFFIPQPPDGLYYTVGQLRQIEKELVGYGLDLYPLDPHAIN